MPGGAITQKVTISPDAVPESFSPAQVLGMGALLSGQTKTSAARAAGVSRKTIHKWLADDPEFLAYYNSARLEMAEAVEQSLRLLSARAVKALRVLLSRRSTDDAVKLRAAVEVLRLTMKPVEGPVEAEDATNKITHRIKARKMETLRARIGLSDEELKRHLSRPISRRELDEQDEIRDRLDDDLDDDEDEDGGLDGE